MVMEYLLLAQDTLPVVALAPIHSSSVICNNDHIWDIAVANSGTSNLFLIYGYGNGTFGNEVSYYFGYGYHPYSIAVTDLNGDGWMDVVVACYDTDHIESFIQMC